VPKRILATVALAVLVAACGEDGADGDDHAGSPVPDGARTVEVTASDFEFDPDTIEVEPGEPIRVELVVRNEPHDFVIDEVDAHAAGEDGDTAVGGFTAPEDPGEYKFYCSVANHQELGMEGTLVVTGG
jgi:plastocyanin